MRAGARSHVTARRPLRCRATVSLPWRTNLAVVLSIAAIAGCGQAAQPPERASADRPSGATRTARDVAPRPTGAADAGRVVDGAATPGVDPASERPAAGDGPGTGPVAHGERPREETSVATAPPEVDVTEQPPASTVPGAPDGGPGDAAIDEEAGDRLDALEHTVVALLGTVREDTGAPRLQIDATLVAGARDRACAMADGATPLLAEDDTENIGLVVEGEPDAAARAMHDWWMQSSSTRGTRMAEHYTQYGVGACTDGDRVYYSERFGP
jgi:uncharacterized protein YkwD